jgi:hypothetical protein
MIIYIPTLGRVQEQLTLRGLPPKWLERTYLVAQRGEQHVHQSVQCPVSGNLGLVRQWTIEHADTNFPFLIDDDMIFCKRKDGRLLNIPPEEVGPALDLMERWLKKDHLAQVGIGPRSGNHFYEGDYQEVSRVFGNFGFNRALFLREGIRFDRVDVMSDFDVTLQLLEKGHKNRVSFLYGMGQKAAGQPGGCALYRTPEMQARVARQLQQLHPEVVRLVMVKKKSWKTLSEHLDVQIQWRKAYGSRTSSQTFRQASLLPSD